MFVGHSSKTEYFLLLVSQFDYNDLALSTRNRNNTSEAVFLLNKFYHSKLWLVCDSDNPNLKPVLLIYIWFGKSVVAAAVVIMLIAFTTIAVYIGVAYLHGCSEIDGYIYTNFLTDGKFAGAVFFTAAEIAAGIDFRFSAAFHLSGAGRWKGYYLYR